MLLWYVFLKTVHTNNLYESDLLAKYNSYCHCKLTISVIAIFLSTIIK